MRDHTTYTHYFDCHNVLKLMEACPCQIRFEIAHGSNYQNFTFMYDLISVTGSAAENLNLSALRTVTERLFGTILYFCPAEPLVRFIKVSWALAGTSFNEPDYCHSGSHSTERGDCNYSENNRSTQILSDSCLSLAAQIYRL